MIRATALTTHAQEPASADDARADYAAALAAWRAAVSDLRAAKKRLAAAEQSERIAARRMPDDGPAGLGDKADRNLQIWRRWKAGEQYAALAKEFGVSASRLRQIVQKVEWLNRKSTERA